MFSKNLAACLLSVGLFLVSALLAADKPEKVKSVNPPGPPPVIPLVPEEVPQNLLFTFETYSLPQAALDAILAAPSASKKIYDSVRQQVTEGKAALETVIALPSKSGNRATSESIDEVIYPTEFDPQTPGRDFSFPTAFEMRPTGERIELDPVLGPDGSLADLNVAPDFTRLAGLALHQAEPQSGGELQPLFTTRKTTTSVSCPIGAPVFLGTMSMPQRTGLTGADGAADTVGVTFVCANLSGPKEVMPAPEAVPVVAGNLRMVFRCYSLPRTAARAMLADSTDGDMLHAKVRALPAAEGTLERVLTLHTRSGQRATVEEVAENIYGTETKPPHSGQERKVRPAAPAPASNSSSGQAAASASEPQQNATHDPAKDKAGPPSPGFFTAFEMRPLGWRVEVDPVLGPDGKVVDLNLSLEHVEHRGNLQGHAVLSRYPQQPVFATQKITTAVTAIVGHQCFLGTMNAPRDTGVNGRKDDGRAWFAFVQVVVE